MRKNTVNSDPLNDESLVLAAKRSLDEHRHREEFLATLGHEMRNPLSALSYALEVWPDRDPAKMEQLRDTMRRQVGQLLRLSDDLVDTARIAQGKLHLRHEPVGLRQLIDDVCEEVAPLIERRGHTLTVELPLERIVVSGDRSRLLQVFANLLQNAAKFTEPGGSLSVTAETSKGFVCVQVRDSGQGIQDHLLPAIFEPFSQSGDASLVNDGIGIGLRLVKSVVELHGGSVSASSAGKGCGSEFIVTLPLTRAAPNEVLFDSPPTAEPKVRLPISRRILVVDDLESSCELLASMLRTSGHEVAVAHDGITAIRHVLENRPQIVILDIVMKGMNGLDVARRLREQSELKGLVLIALSGNCDLNSQRRAIKAGFDQYLIKPTSIAALDEILADLVRKERVCDF